MKHLKLMKKTMVLSSVLLLTASQAWAGGSFSTTPAGEDVKWDQSQDVVWNPEHGALRTEGGPSNGGGGCAVGTKEISSVTNTQFVNMIDQAFQTWMDVPHSDLNIVRGNFLDDGGDVNFTNIENFWVGGFVFPTPAQSNVTSPTTNPIIAEEDGLVTQAVLGQCNQCNVLGFAAILPETQNDSQGTILSPILEHAQAIVSGACLEPEVVDPICGPCCPEGVDLDKLRGVVTHELGHFLGLDHTLVNKDAYFDCLDDGDCTADVAEQIPTMIGLFVPQADLNTLHEDDMKTFAKLYPDSTQGSQTCTVTGIARLNDNLGPDGKGSLKRCLEVVARDKNDPFNIAVATIAGVNSSRFTQGVAGQSGQNGKNVQNCNEANPLECARYTIQGLEPGSYFLTVHDFSDTVTIDQGLKNFVLEPCTPPLAEVGTLDTPINPNNALAVNFECVKGGKFTTDVKAPK